MKGNGNEKRFTEEQIIGFLKEVDAGMDVPDAKLLKALEDENNKLNRLLADAMLNNAALKNIVS